MEYKWEIVDLTRDVADGFVLSAKWQLTATDGECEAIVSGHCGFERGSSEIKSFDALTQDEVLSWVWASGFDKVAQEQYAASLIEEQKTKTETKVAAGVPWA